MCLSALTGRFICPQNQAAELKLSDYVLPPLIWCYKFLLQDF